MSQEAICRICLSEEGFEEDNPLVFPCKCSGSVKNIHIKCLKQWIRSQTYIRQTQYSTSIIWKTFECELCHTTFPSYFLNLKNLKKNFLLFQLKL